MKKRIFLILLLIIYAFCLCSCTKKQSNRKTQKIEMEVPYSSVSSELESSIPVTEFESFVSSVQIINSTGLDIIELDISEYRRFDWSKNLLEDYKTLNNFESTSIDLKNIEAGKTYDIKATTNDKQEFVWENIELSRVSQVDLKIVDYLPTATFELNS